MNLTPYADGRVVVWEGDCLEALAALPPDSVDAIVTDPPYGLGFMGKAWDALPPGQPWAEACLRVLKPGGHLLAFGGTRTWHRLAVAIEDGGFEIRDSLAWLYGSGFPKSMDVSKAIDKAAGATREIIGEHHRHGGGSATSNSMNGLLGTASVLPLTASATPGAMRWEGWGTALKPAFEPIVMGRKPFPGTVAANVLAHGTGAVNIDACRIEGSKPDTTRGASVNATSTNSPLGAQGRILDDGRGRWPTNVVLDEPQADDLGEAARFFYVAKAPKSERPVVEHQDGTRTAHPTVKPLALMRWLVRLITPPDGLVLDTFAGSGTTGEAAVLEGLRCLLVEREADYLPLINARLTRASSKEPTPRP